MRRRHILGLLTFLVACGGGTYDVGGDTYWRGGPVGDTAGGPPVLPPEEEELLRQQPPAQTDRYVFVASPERNTVTRIDALTHALQTVAVGSTPRLLRTTPDHAQVLVLNRGDHTITVLDAQSLEARTVAVRPHLNQMALSDDGSFAALWYDPRADRPDDAPPTGSQSFNEVSFLRLSDLTHHPMAVGYSPRRVQFTPDNQTAVVVADDAAAVVDLTQPTLLPSMIALSDEVESPGAQELILGQGGRWGLLRQLGADSLLVLDLKEHLVHRVPVGAGPSDLKRTPDGQSVVAVARESRELWIYDLADPLGEAQVLPLPGSTPFGQLTFAPGGEHALLFTNATPTDRIAIWTPADQQIRERQVVKPVRAIEVDPSGGTALIFHSAADAPGAPTSPFTGRWALTMLSLSDLRANPLLLPAEPTEWAATHDGARAFFIMEDQPWLEVLHFDTLLYDEVPLPSLPVFVGVLPQTDPVATPPAWVSQQHDLGRISFYSHDTGSLETLTGFELNSTIE